jgi:DNA polymerase I-like protein with 3'-5' exonuclease and polymerase domains
MKAAMVKIWTWLRDNKLTSRILLTVHDELCIEVTPVERWIVPKIKRMMADRDTYYVPIEVGVEVARRRWSEKVDVECSKREMLLKDKETLIAKLALTPPGVN